MKRIAIIGAGEFQNPLIEKAREMGYETHVFAWKSGDIGERTADFFYPISIVEKDAILEKCREIQPDAVTTIASDLATLTVNYVAEKLGLPHNSALCTECSTNKYRMRQEFLRAGVPTPAFALADAEDLSALGRLSYPLIVKPTDRSGSRGITRITCAAQAAGAVRRAAEYSFEKKAIAEEVIEGPEYSCESISAGGVHHVLALTKKYTTGAPHFIETGHIEPSDIPPELQESVKADVRKALDALHIATGASHAEFRLSKDGRAHIIEIGARMGGDCIGSHLVRLSTGYDFVGMTIQAAAGEPVSPECGLHYEAAGIRFIFDAQDLDNKARVKREIAGLIVEESPVTEENLAKAVDSSTRAGFYIMAGEKALVERAMRLTQREGENNQ